PIHQPRFDAAGRAVVVGLLDGRAAREVEGNDVLVVQELGDSLAFLDRFAGGVQEAVRRARVDAAGDLGVGAGPSALRVQDQEGNVVGGIASFGGLAAQRHGLEVRVAFQAGSGGR